MDKCWSNHRVAKTHNIIVIPTVKCAESVVPIYVSLLSSCASLITALLQHMFARSDIYSISARSPNIWILKILIFHSTMMLITIAKLHWKNVILKYLWSFFVTFNTNATSILS